MKKLICVAVLSLTCAVSTAEAEMRIVGLQQTQDSTTVYIGNVSSRNSSIETANVIFPDTTITLESIEPCGMRKITTHGTNINVRLEGLSLTDDRGFYSECGPDSLIGAGDRSYHVVRTSMFLSGGEEWEYELGEMKSIIEPCKLRDLLDQRRKMIELMKDQLR